MLKKIAISIYKRVFLHWQSTLAAILLGIGYFWFWKSKIDFTEFQTYIAGIAGIILLLMKNFKNDTDNKDK